MSSARFLAWKILHGVERDRSNQPPVCEELRFIPGELWQEQRRRGFLEPESLVLSRSQTIRTTLKR
jgi:hypothetical protein